MAGIFKAYDIRGIIGDALNDHIAYLIGRGLAQNVFEGASPIFVTRDMRPHGVGLTAELARGLAEGGCDVIDAGLAATPMNYWGNANFKAQGSVTVTASHNGPEYNGFKVSGPGGIPIDHSTGLDKVEEYVMAALNDGDPAPVEKPGQISNPGDILTPYLDFMAQFVKGTGQEIHLGVDTANGMGGFFMPAFQERYPWIKVSELYYELDGTFPNHEADPLKPENLHDLEALVKAKGCDIGVAYDGDADRCMFVDNTGTPISSDLVTALIAQTMLAENPGAAILFDLRSSKIVPETIADLGGKPVRGRVGHSFMKRLLKANDAPFGGELSGHYYFKACFNTDSGLMAMIQMVNIWLAAQKNGPVTLAEMVAPLRKYSASGEVNFRVEDLPATLKKIEDHYLAAGATTDHLDGLTVDCGHWWFNLRSSNTEPLLRLNLEGPTPEDRDKHFQEVTELIGGTPVKGH